MVEPNNTNENKCIHGIHKDQWIRHGLGIWGCEKCIIEYHKKQNKDSWIFLGMMMGMGMAIIGGMFGFVSFLVYGLQIWNVSLTVVCLFIWCLPMILEYRDEGKIDLRPRFMK